MAYILSVGANLAKRKVARGLRKTEADDHAVQAVGEIIEIYDNLTPSDMPDVFDVVYVEIL